MKCGPKKVSDLAIAAKGTVIGNPNVEVDGFSSVEEAMPGDVVYAEKRKALALALKSSATCIVVKEAPEAQNRTFIIVDSPRLAFARIVHHMAPPKLPDAGVHPSALVSEGAIVAPKVHVGPFSVVEKDAQIGEGSVVLAGSYIGRGCTIGKGCVIGPHAVLYQGVHLGNRVVVQAGSVLGSDGFGYVMDESKNYFKIPQLGTVIVEDDVEIGSNTSVDRATLGVTKIGRDSKLDNLVQIGHNVEIGSSCAISGQAGVAGSSEIGSHCILAGQVGVADHASIGDRVIIGGQSGVPTGKRVKGDQVIFGSPARPIAEAMKMLSALALLAKRKGEKRE